jgi:hypothetical protein
MPRAILSATLVVVASAAMAATVSQRPESGRADDADVVTIRGCVSGSLLKSVQADPATVASPLTANDRYRMIGSKEMRAQIKKANKALVQVTGRVKPGPQTVVRGKKVGGTTIGIGVAQGSSSMDQQTPYTPTIEVEAVEIIAKSCGEN